jgi:hypothetical protein
MAEMPKEFTVQIRTEGITCMACAKIAFKCAALAAGTAGGNDPQDCNWPTCGCDQYASKVIEALQESGLLK